MSALLPAVFLDRDGTLIEEVDYLTRIDELALVPHAARSLRELEQAGFLRVLVTNQSGVARGYLTEERLHEIHAELERRLAHEGAGLDRIEYCPHHPDSGEPPLRADCECRKPLPGMLKLAARELRIDLARSWTVGDSARDLAAGAAAGVRGVLVATGKGAAEHERLVAGGTAPEHYVADLEAAVRLILESSRGGA